MSGRTGMGGLALIGAAVALTVWTTWPLATCVSVCVAGATGDDPFVNARLMHDGHLTLWILAWATHILSTAPTSLYDANIFHPAPHALTTTEHLLGAQPLYAPIALLSGDPVVAQQVMLLVSIAASFLTAAALTGVWTGSWTAAFVTGTTFAFSSFRMAHLAALQMAGLYLLPLVVLCAERASHGRSRWWSAGLAVTLALQALHSYYSAYAIAVMLGLLIAIAAAGDGRLRTQWRRVIVPSGIAVVAVGLLSLPYLLMPRDVTEIGSNMFIQLGSAHPGRTGASSVAVALAVLLAPWWRRAVSGRVALSWPIGLTAGGIACHLLALGPVITLGDYVVPGPYALASHIIPGWSFVRSPLRFNAPMTLAVAVGAGLGIAGVLQRYRDHPRGATLIRVGAVALAIAITAVTVRAPMTPFRVDTRSTMPPVYRWLADAAAGAVLELPFHDFGARGDGRGVEARRTYLSVYHWHPLLNAYSGYTPPSYPAVSALATALPDAESVTLLRRLTGVRWIVLHRDELDATTKRRWRRTRNGLRTIAVLGRDVVFAPRELRPPDLVAGLLAYDAASTPLGTPRTTVPPASRRATLELVTEITHRPFGLPAPVRVTVASRDATAWPAVGSGTRGLTTLGYQWLARDGRAIDERLDAGRISRDVTPGAGVPSQLLIHGPPGAPAPLRLRIGVVQDGTWFDGALERCFTIDGHPTACAPAVIP